MLYKLNSFTLSFQAEAVATHKALDFVKEASWTNVNICTDSLVFQAIQQAEMSFYSPFLLYLNPIIIDISYKIFRLQKMNNSFKFTWCPTHKEINSNELVDQLTKNASITGLYLKNCITYREIIASYKEYSNINKQYNEDISKGTGSYYMSNFRDIKVKYVLKLTSN